MYSYLAKRFLNGLIVLFSVVTAVYVLQVSGVSDPVDEFVVASFGDLNSSKDEYEKVYIKEAIRQKKNLPGFYFSILPRYFPDTLHRIIFQGDRQFLKDAMRYSGCTDCAFDLMSRMDEMSTISDTDTTLNQDQVASLMRISRERNFNKLKTQFNQLKSLEMTNPRVSELQKSYQSLINTVKSFTLPKLVWYGKNNQYHHYILGVLRGELGKSKSDGKSAGNKIKGALKWTLIMNIIAFILSALIGLWLGMWSIKNDGKPQEKWVNSFFLFLYTMPRFWTATLLLVFFTSARYGSWMDIFPSPGFKYWYADEPFLKQIGLNASQLILPVICMTIPSLAYMSRIMKSKFAEVLSSNFVTTLKAKGLSRKLIFNRHILKNGLIPYITILTGSIPGLFAGSLIIEVIFNIPGIGKLLIDSIYSTDWPVISGLVIMMAVVTVLAYFLADILYSRVNPRIRLGN